ncbi:DUF899 family protein [Actinoplanes sp. NPDC020271]|uniref:DUF899 family protein n=1 Tax=Actinoplanes sp. NPDC020271 TaxID=3363896 RepID=UPI0037992862
MSCFLRADDAVSHTYSTFARGTEQFGGSYGFLDMTALGRQEDWRSRRAARTSPVAPSPPSTDPCSTARPGPGPALALHPSPGNTPYPQPSRRGWRGWCSALLPSLGGTAECRLS